MKNKYTILLGIILILAGIWGPAIVCQYAPLWYDFPTILTGVLALIAGAVCIALALGSL